MTLLIYEIKKTKMNKKTKRIKYPRINQPKKTKGQYAENYDTDDRNQR